MLRRVVRASVTPLLDWMARHGAQSYIAGRSIESALAACHRSSEQVGRFIVCPWDRPEDHPATVFRSYQTALRALGGAGLDCYLSIKLPSLAFDRGRLEELLSEAQGPRIRIHLDAMTPESVEPTLRVLEALRGRFSNLGYTVPGRWRRSLTDLPRILALEIPLRVVKGQLPDKRGGESAPREGFCAVIERLVSSRTVIGVATHEPSLAEHTVGLLTAAHVRCELEQLFRLRPLPAALQQTIPRRLYVPYGFGYPPYDIYAALKKPSMGLRLLGDVLRGLRRGESATLHHRNV